MPECSAYSLPYAVNPATYFNLIRSAPNPVLLDSCYPQSLRGNYDILSAWPLRILSKTSKESGSDFFQRLRSQLEMLKLPKIPSRDSFKFVGGLIGYLSYDFARSLENIPSNASNDLKLPHARFGVYLWALITNHSEKKTQLVFHPMLGEIEKKRLISLFSNYLTPNRKPFRLIKPFRMQETRQRYKQSINKIHKYLNAGDCYQINYAQRFSAPFEGDVWSAYCALRSACPTPFSGFIGLPKGTNIISLSPERFIKVTYNTVETRPIKGTRPRGKNNDEDRKAAIDLLNSAKDRSENLMIVDLLRSDLSRSCLEGSISVPELFKLESYPNVHHMVSSIIGKLPLYKDGLHLLEDSFPGGSITGVPKIRAMEIIDELELSRRSIYCGSLVYVDFRGEMDSSIAIRSLLAEEGRIYCWGGGAIISESICQDEYTESILKVKLLLRTLQNL